MPSGEAAVGFKAVAAEFHRQRAAGPKRAAPKQAKGMLGEIGAQMQAMRGAQRAAPRKQAKGMLGAIGAKLNSSMKNL